MGKADLHIHTEWSDGLPSVREVLEHIENQTDLDLVAITDHDMIEGAFEALEIVAQKHYRFELIVGMEVTTLEGHLLAYDLKQPLRMMKPLDWTIQAIRDQGGWCLLPHPMSPLIRSVGARGIRRVMRDTRTGISFDGIEVMNPSIAGRVIAGKARRFNAEARLPETGGSDAHTLDLIGSGHTLFEGHSAADFKASLAASRTQAGGAFWGGPEYRALAKIARRQMYKSMIQLPLKHIRRSRQIHGGKA
ncbi:MAG: PHP domain-containing protein [Chloroflexi bacterium]|nr:PHP domain-containing protein [Chloroflexota bacterium]